MVAPAVARRLCVTTPGGRSGIEAQSRDEYAAGHLGEDIAFMKAAQITPVSLASKEMGETAVVGSESEIRATVNGEPRTFRSREVLTLKRESGAWKIVAVQWQSTPDGK